MRRGRGAPRGAHPARRRGIVWGAPPGPGRSAAVSMATQPVAADFGSPARRGENAAGRGREGRGRRGGGGAGRRDANARTDAPGREEERDSGRGAAGRALTAGIVPAFLNLIYHIITPRRKKTSISRRHGSVSMENRGILVQNRSGVKKTTKPKRSKPGLRGAEMRL